jgi:hypothetical protein
MKTARAKFPSPSIGDVQDVIEQYFDNLLNELQRISTKGWWSMDVVKKILQMQVDFEKNLGMHGVQNKEVVDIFWTMLKTNVTQRS